MINCIKTWIAYKVAGDELRELVTLKRNIDDLKVWCSHNKDVSVAAEWLQHPTKYPYQSFGCHGSIEDFRRYLDKLDKGEFDE
ncbi:MAG: hypothetical protein GY861_16875 [bacterium]|nr:hypothetical protein [bacterium]